MYLGSQLFIVLVFVVLVLKLYLNQRQATSITRNVQSVPQRFSAHVSLQEHSKAAQYNLVQLSVAQLNVVVAAIVMLFFTLGGGLQMINAYVAHFNFSLSSPLTQGVLVIGVFSAINALIDLPFGIFSTFWIEQKFGFNNTTVKLFILDLFKGIILSLVIGVPMLYLVLWLMNIMGGLWWLWVWVALVAFNLVLLVVYPTFIAPLFNKFTPLSDLALKDRIDALLVKCGFKSRGVFVMDGSKRSSHGNAYFTGIGKSKRIVFFDTVLKQLNIDEIEAVLAHELGHFKKKHIIKQMVLMFGLTLIMLFILSLLINQPEFYRSLGVKSSSNYNGLILFSYLLGQIGFLFAPLSSYFSRKNEFEADDFAVTHTNREHLISGLIKLYRDNAATLTPDPLYVKFYYSHPPASIRIQNLEK